jgi:methylmalonyl-CoA/ethylmalonyl-CoA epimerase
MFNRLINVAVAVEDIEAAVARYREAFGWPLEGEINTQPGLGIRTAILNAGDVSIELLSPLPGETVLRRFLDTRGEGLYRLAFATDELDADLARLRETNVSFVDLSGAAGRGDGSRIVFTHPKSAHGLMLELVEGHPGPAAAQAGARNEASPRA